jgi:hypothetical protein
MFDDAITVARLEHAGRERAYRRAMGDPEQAWLIETDRQPAALAVNLRAAGRALQTIVLAVLGRS